MSRKKVGTSSESGSSSNSSGSSSSSSSSSGSDSSSSDSDASSAPSQRSLRSLKTRGHSTDSDSQPPAKKAATPAAKNANKSVPSKAAADSDKKGQKNKNSKLAYSSDSDDSVPVKPTTNSASKQRKVPAKPKATATVTPVVRKPAAPASKTAPKGKSNAQNKAAPKVQPKTKSIFSPEHSSESDGPEAPVVKASTSKAIVQNKNGAIKKQAPVKTASTASASKSKDPPPRRNTRYSTSTSTGSSNSSDSSSDSDSSPSPEVTPQKRPQKKSSTQSKGSPAKSNATRVASGSETETSPSKQPVTRKLTRSANVRRSKLVSAKHSDSESEIESKPTKTVPPPSGKKAPARVVSRKSKGRPSSSADMNTISLPLEERKCPVRNCDSSGHLSGKYDKHFTVDACPIFHNLKNHQCYDLYLERKKRDDERKRATNSLGRKSPGRMQSNEQKTYQQKVKDSRDKAAAILVASDTMNSINDSLIDFNREPKLNNVTSDYDLRLFMEAQAAASEKMEEDLRGLPNNKGTKFIEMGKFDMEVWYQSPYPEEYASLPKLYLCEFCLRYMKTRTVLKRHLAKCVWRHPPGEEVYRKDKISVWEVDGKKYKVFCQNLCLLAKFFLDHKTLYNEVEPFLFYVMTTADSEGCHTVGYFSKEKNSFLNYNVSCILTLPPYQRQGFGRLLIDFSYQLTRKEGKIGSPEKPLSDLGLISYRSYWKDVLLEYLCNFGGKELSIKDISQEMAINSYDIVSTLQALGMMKYWKGKHIILKKQDVIDEYVERSKRRTKVKEIDPSCLNWTPPVNPQSRGPP